MEDNFYNIVCNSITYPDYLFNVRSRDRKIQLFRTGKHCLKQPQKGEGRWVRFPICIELVKGKEYCIDCDFEATRPMKRYIFLAVGNQTQVFDCFSEYSLHFKDKIRFVSELEGKADIVVTATDMPIGSTYLYINKMNFIV